MSDESGDVPEIVKRLSRAIVHMHPLEFKRVRLAVTPGEFETIRQFCLATEGRFFSRIRGVPLLIEEHPTGPLLAVETATDGPGQPSG